MISLASCGDCLLNSIDMNRLRSIRCTGVLVLIGLMLLSVGFAATASVTYTFSLNERQSGTIAIGTVKAIDDNEETINYALIDAPADRFMVDASDGVVSYIGSGENTPASYVLTVQASDGKLAATTTITVAVLDVNIAPEFASARYPFTLDQNQTGIVALGNVVASDDDGDAISYALVGASNSLFYVDPVTGKIDYIGSGEPQTINYTLMAQASDGIATDTAAVTIEVKSTEVLMRTQMVSMSLAQVSRNLAIDLADVLGDRFVEAPHVTVSGHALASKWSELSRWTTWNHWQSVGGWNGVESEVELDFDLEARWNKIQDNLLTKSTFLVPLGAVDDGDSGMLENWSIWGRGRISGYQYTDAGIKVSGKVTSGYLGVDYKANDNLLLGVAVSRSSSDGYSEVSADGSNHTDVDTELTSIYPYLHWKPMAGFELWGTVGRGQGEAEVKDQEPALRVTDIEMLVAAAGVKQALAPVGDTDIAVKADAFVVQIKSDKVAELNATDSGSHRLRIALSGSRSWPSSVGNARTVAGLELGGRFDGGDSVQGQGLDIGANLGYINPDCGLEISSRVRLLLAHSKDYREWGLDLTIRLQPGQLGRGLSLTLEPGWGKTTTAINTLWNNGVSTLKTSNANDQGVVPDRTKLTFSYGLHYRSVLLRPFVEMGMNRGDLSDLHLGLRLDRSGVRVDVFGNQDQKVGIKSTIRF